MANTTNFGWETPDDTDLVKDGAAAIRTLGSAIDTSLVDLKGGTTGQVLAKASNTDMDFTWATDAAGIPATIFDAKGDIIAASAADTAARLAVGTNGQYLSANSSTSTGLEWVTLSAGGWTLINTGGTTLSGATTTINSITGTYQKLALIIQNFRPAADTDLRLYFNADTNTRYKYVTGDTASFTFANSNILISGDSDADAASQGFSYTEIPNYANTTTWKTLFSYSFTNLYNLNTSGTCVVSYGVYNQTSAITSLTLKPGTGNFTSGTAYLYGVK
jgi:hypothetical protein